MRRTKYSKTPLFGNVTSELIVYITRHNPNKLIFDANRRKDFVSNPCNNPAQEDIRGGYNTKGDIFTLYAGHFRMTERLRLTP